ncbi:MAG TPA: hypothetical protein PLN40_02535 [Agitococcus sp.]|nr:hypothetical protein [Agitococcus sp.]HNG10287.1 hypothetical protein [Agitococcus sp.]HNH43107.1 hypothetical protein [Agitococcus sp.]HNP01574.1 hypothetical protein [Agitococcus sp.]
MSTLLSRRAFLRTSTIGTIALTTATTSTLTACSSTPSTPSKGFNFLREGDLKLFSALIPVVLHSMIQTETPNYQALQINILKNVDGACSNLAYKAQTEIYKLLDLLDGRITRWLTTGVLDTWQQASPEDVNHFLQRWQSSSISPFNAGYRVLSKLVAVSYFSLPEAQAQSGYNHLPALYQAINS